MELFFTTLAFFIITLCASYIFFLKIKQAQEEYEYSKEIVSEITRGFSSQLRRLIRSINAVEERVIKAQNIASQALLNNEKVENSSKEIEKIDQLTTRLDNMDNAISEVKREVNTIIQTLNKGEIKTVEIEAPIHVVEEVVLNQLTETEREVLIILEESNESSVPQIRKKIGKTREHTARTLKKLYDKGFIDRNTSSMPYRYSIRKEIREMILQKKGNVQIGV